MQDSVYEEENEEFYNQLHMTLLRLHEPRTVNSATTLLMPVSRNVIVGSDGLRMSCFPKSPFILELNNRKLWRQFHCEQKGHVEHRHGDAAALRFLPGEVTPMTRRSSGTSQARGSAQYRELSLFLLLTFGIAWILWIPLLIPSFFEVMPFGGIGAASLGAFAPAVGAIAVLRRRGHSARKWFQRRLRFRVGLRSYLLAFGLPVAVPAFAGLMYLAIGGDPVFEMPPLAALPVIFVYSTLIGGGQEEIGWRGVAQPMIGDRCGLFIGGAVVGVVWVLWHLPLILSSIVLFESINPVVFGFQTVGVSIIMAWLYEKSGRNLAMVILFHGWRNATEAFYPSDVLARSVAVVVIWLFVLIAVAVEHTRGKQRKV